jgi:hypothetical protein
MMPLDTVPDDFDWIAAQSTCTAESMFARLQAGVTKDVRSRNGLIGRDDHWKFEIVTDVDDFEVERVGPSSGGAAVTFTREGRRIHVHGDGVDIDFTAIVALNAAGACRFVVGEAEYLDWEVRKMALELLFFEEPE